MKASNYDENHCHFHDDDFTWITTKTVASSSDRDSTFIHFLQITIGQSRTVKVQGAKPCMSNVCVT